MNASVTFSPNDAFACALNLMFHPPQNEEDLKKASKNLQQKFAHLSPAHEKPKHRNEFCSYLLSRIAQQKPLSPEKITQTAFFQDMKCVKLSPFHETILKALVPTMLEKAHEQNLVDKLNKPSIQVHEWLACFLESYFTEDQLRSYCSNPQNEPNLITDCPGDEWEFHSRFGWSDAKLNDVRDYTKGLKTAAVMIVQNGKIVDQWGETEKKFLVHSIRKSFMNALYGIHVDKGIINLGKTMDQCGIDDKQPSLTSIEKQAAILDLLRARSGIYHAAAYETEAMKAAKPARGSHQPSEFWYYNNWDFNALGGIFEQQTHSKIFEALETEIARPLKMQDFKASDGTYSLEPESTYPAYDFAMSARDMARFGLLYLRNGRWNDQQIIPAEWVIKSSTAYTSNISESMPYNGYGLLWWISDFGYLALGHGGHVIAVIPSKDLVIIHRVDNDNDEPENAVSAKDFDKMIRMIIDAAPTSK